MKRKIIAALIIFIAATTPAWVWLMPKVVMAAVTVGFLLGLSYCAYRALVDIFEVEGWFN